MKITAAFLMLSAIATAQQSQPIAPIPPPPQRELPRSSTDLLDHWRRATVALGQVYEVEGKRRFVTNGSAVIVAVNADTACLVTAKHMFFDPDSGYLPTQISMRLPQDGPTKEEDLGVVIPLVVGGRNLWKTTQTKSDLAAVQLPDLHQYRNLHAVGLQDFGTSDDIYQSAAILVLGYPGILGEHYQTTPIARGGMVAWTDPDEPERKPFLVDSNVFQGNSGGPVFHLKNGSDRYGNIILGGGVSFVGIMSQDAQEYSDVLLTNNAQHRLAPFNVPNPVTKMPETLLAQVKNIGGIGVVEPVAVVRELLEDAYGKPRGYFSDPAHWPKLPISPPPNQH